MLVLQVVVLGLEGHIQALWEGFIHQVEPLEVELVTWLHLLVVNHFDDFLVAVKLVLLVAHRTLHGVGAIAQLNDAAISALLDMIHKEDHVLRDLRFLLQDPLEERFVGIQELIL